MNFKVLALAAVTVSFLFQMLLEWLDAQSVNRPIPANMEGVYDAESYSRWQCYYREKCRLYMVWHLVSYLLTMALIGLDVYARVLYALGLPGAYWGAIGVILTDSVINTVVLLPVDYIDDFVIEQKYGFNKKTPKIFAVDQLKNFLISNGVLCAILCVFIALHHVFGNWLLLIFTAVMLVVLLAIVFIAPALGKIHNHFEPLPEGELRSRLQKLLEDNGCTVKAINVMDGSKRSTKANAYFSGFGKSKTIVLYDTLLEQMTDDEIVAVFAHEMGHNKHRDTLKMYCFSGVNVALMVVIAWALVSIPSIYSDFGFRELNYGFAFNLLGIVLNLVNPLLSLVISGASRRFEYAADAFAADNGYAQALISGLKKLERNSFGCLNPHPMLVALSYSHPTVSQRVAALSEK